MRRCGANFAMSANGTATTAPGRAASSGLSTVMRTPAAPAVSIIATAAIAQGPFMAPPLRNHDGRIDYRPERPLGAAGRIEQQRIVGARARQRVVPGVPVVQA